PAGHLPRHAPPYRVARRVRFPAGPLPTPQRRLHCRAGRLVLAWLVRLARRGKDASKFVSTLVTFASRQVWSGRRLAGGENSKDALSGRARRRHGFRVEPLVSTRRPFDDFYGSVHGQQELDVFEERLRDNAVTPPPDAAAFRIDFCSWLQTQAERDRRLI